MSEFIESFWWFVVQIESKIKFVITNDYFMPWDNKVSQERFTFYYYGMRWDMGVKVIRNDGILDKKQNGIINKIREGFIEFTWLTVGNWLQMLKWNW